MYRGEWCILGESRGEQGGIGELGSGHLLAIVLAFLWRRLLVNHEATSVKSRKALRKAGPLALTGDPTEL